MDITKLRTLLNEPSYLPNVDVTVDTQWSKENYNEKENRKVNLMLVTFHGDFEGMHRLRAFLNINGFLRTKLRFRKGIFWEQHVSLLDKYPNIKSTIDKYSTELPTNFKEDLYCSLPEEEHYIVGCKLTTEPSLELEVDTNDNCDLLKYTLDIFNNVDANNDVVKQFKTEQIRFEENQKMKAEKNVQKIKTKYNLC